MQKIVLVNVYLHINNNIAGSNGGGIDMNRGTLTLKEGSISNIKTLLF